MHSITELFDLIATPTGQAERTEHAVDIRRLFLAVVGLLGAVGLASVWGIAAGSHDGHFAFDNAFKVPTLFLVSSLTALPAALLAFRLAVHEARPDVLFVGHASAAFAGALVLALLSPIVAIYQYSSAWAGPVSASASAALAAVVALLMLARVLRKLLPKGAARRKAAVPVAVLLVLQAASLMQLSSMTTPVYPHRTRLGGGIDALTHAVKAP